MTRPSIFKMAGMLQPDPELEIEVVQESSFDNSAQEEPDGQFTMAEIKEALPAALRSKVTPALMEKLNGLSKDPDLADEIRNNFIGFNNIMNDGRFKFEDYLNACAYSTFKMMGYSNQQAWGLTFPDKLAKMRAENRDDQYISAFVASFAKGKLVNIILEQAMIPSFVLNQDLHQKALNVCAGIMANGSSDKVKVEAARAILEATKAPEKSKVQVDLTLKDASGIGELKQIMQEVAENQIKQIEGGRRTQDIAHQSMFEEGSPQ